MPRSAEDEEALSRMHTAARKYVETVLAEKAEPALAAREELLVKLAIGFCLQAQLNMLVVIRETLAQHVDLLNEHSDALVELANRLGGKP